MCGVTGGPDERPARAIESLHARYAAALRQRCLLLLGDPVDADDAVQETFLQAIGELRSCPPAPGVAAAPTADRQAWLYTIATRVCLQLLRHRSRLPGAVQSCAAEDPVRLVAGRQIIRRLLRHIDARTLEILASHVLDGDSQGEIAEQLGISRRAVVKRLSKLRRMIDRLLSDKPPRRSRRRGPPAARRDAR